MEENVNFDNEVLAYLTIRKVLTHTKFIIDRIRYYRIS